MIGELLVVVDHIVAHVGRVMVVALRLLNGNITRVRTEKRVGLLALLYLFILIDTDGHKEGYSKRC